MYRNIITDKIARCKQKNKKLSKKKLFDKNTYNLLCIFLLDITFATKYTYAAQFGRLFCFLDLFYNQKRFKLNNL